MRGARLAREVWGDAAYADRLEREAAALQDRFDRDFWIADRGYYALAVDGDGRQVDALASNMGHLLWSGIVRPERAAQVVGHLLLSVVTVEAPAPWHGLGLGPMAVLPARQRAGRR